MLYAFREESGLSDETALKIACGLGAGMAGKQEVCGAITGGILVIGLKHGRGENDDRTAAENAYSRTRQLMERFSEKRGSFICRQLLNGCDLTTQEGRAFFNEHDLLNATCKPCVESAVEILEGIL